MIKEVIKFLLAVICTSVAYIFLGRDMYIGLFAFLLALGISLY